MISQEVVNEFFDELVAGVGDITTEKMFNYYEANITANPGMKKCFVRRGATRVEMIREHSKTVISVMWCGSYTRRSMSTKVGRRAAHVGPSTMVG